MDKEELKARQDEIFGYAAIHTAHITLGMAKRLLELAKERYTDSDGPSDPETLRCSDSSILAGCTIIMLATALEQGIGSVLTGEAWRISFEDGVNFWDTPHAKLDEDFFRKRIEGLPSLLTNGRFCLSPTSHLSQRLVKLIKWRNTLVHVNEKAKYLTGKNGQIRVVGDMIEVGVPLMNEWLKVSLQDAESFHEVVSIYFDEVLFPESGEIEAGRIVVPAA